MQFPFSREVAIDEVGDSGVGEQEEGGGMVVVEEKVCCCWGGDEAGCGEEVGNIVDVFGFGASATGEGGADGGGSGFGALTGGFECGG